MKLILTGVIAVVVGFVGGYSLAVPQVDKIVSRLEADDSLIFRDRVGAFSISGEVREVRGSEMLVVSDTPSIRAIVTGKDDVRRVAVTDETRIIRHVRKSEEELAIELEEFEEAMRLLESRMEQGVRVEERPFLPQEFTEVDGSFSDISVGSSVNVSSESEIVEGETITATEVRITTTSE